jgi:hypothetical protein
MVEPPTHPPPNIQSSSEDTFDKDVEIQSIHSSSHSDSIRDEEYERRVMTMTEKGDIEAYPGGVNEPQNEEWNGSGIGPMARASTKSSWKDPGPPPDGGWSGWTQGMVPPQHFPLHRFPSMGP